MKPETEGTATPGDARGPAQAGTLALDIARMIAPTAAVMGRLVTLHVRLKAGGRRLALLNAGPMAYEAFLAAGLLALLGVRRAGV